MGKKTLFVIVILLITFAGTAMADELPDYLRDRGEGVPVSMFGTYVTPGELILYPFYEYYYDHDAEYSPGELGYKGPESSKDFRGKYEAHEFVFFVGYGFTDYLAGEFEASVISARQKKDSDDTSDMPSSVEESGLGDVEGQLRLRLVKERQYIPMVFTFFETVFPTGEDESLIGTSDWEYKLAIGVTKGFRFGTVTLQTAASRDEAEDETVYFEEYTVEYLKRINDKYSVYLGMEAEDDEVEVIPELQWRFRKNMVAKINLAFGATSKATDFAPELGVMFIFP